MKRHSVTSLWPVQLRLLCLLLTGCTVYIPPASPYKQLLLPDSAIEENLLFDVGISLFHDGTPAGGDTERDMALADIRKAEARYMPVVLQHTLRATENWGEIYVLPDTGHNYDVSVEGTILESSGHSLTLEISVHDTSGMRWFKRRYTEHVGDNVFDDSSIGVNDPFQGLYNRIANDMLDFRAREITQAGATRIRSLSALHFGQAFVPEYFTPYLGPPAKNPGELKRLPAQDDPVWVRLAEIRQRDRSFHRILQEHYLGYARKISDSYFAYRRFSYLELRDLRERQADARNEIVAGAFWLGVAIATSDLDDLLGATVSATSALAGGGMIVSGLGSYPDKSLFLDDISESFAGDVITEAVELDENVVILSGSVEELYRQWQDLLRQMLPEELNMELQ